MPTNSTDEQFLRCALDLARQGVSLASPNPHVGAVIVDEKKNIVGSGVYTYAGVKHAEILALEQAGEKARGATLYINLEPHSHQGRTPPCTQALIAAGIRRVVACMPDPNPKVSGRGFEQLRAAGIDVEIGQLEAEARQVNEAFARFIRHGVPLVTLKSAMTLNGKISPPSIPGQRGAAGIPDGGWITGEDARAHVQQQRHCSDAILVGVGTVLADDPLLTDRSGRLRRRPLLRVILDSHLRLPMESRIVLNASGEGRTRNDVLVFCSPSDEKKKQALQLRGVRVEQLPPDTEGRPGISEVMRRLGQLEITSVLIEGGSTVNGAALSSNVVDKVFLYYAPNFLIREGSIPFSVGAANGGKVPPLQNLRLHRFGDDFAVEGYLRDPYQE
jgi:diaminohydroxyphosphoribosylaminopyrimidine deaminase / 5-amino-6-(5-phosphoribosylamino)uracil reductase